MRRLARKYINQIEPYEPGKPIKELKRELGLDEKDIIKLASNENPLGPSPKAVKAILKEVNSINRYPDGSAFYLKRKLASVLKLKPNNFVLGNGSDELIDIITKTFLEEDEEAIITVPSFLEYGIIVKTRGAKIKEVPLKRSVNGFCYDIDKVLATISKKTKLVFLGNPDNPTGAYLNIDELEYLLQRSPDNIIVVFDEAYRELVDAKDYSNPLGRLQRHNNIVILRTFSKAYGLAGLRIGYAITNSVLAGVMEKARLPFNVNSLAQTAAISALDDKIHLAKTKRLIREARIYVASELKKLGLEIVEGPANFILFSCKGMDGTELFKKLLLYGVIIRDMKAYGLREFVRVNIGTMAENIRFIDTLKVVLGG